MVNSRTRSSPARGRASSRNFVWNWYQACGSCLCELSSWARTAKISSWVMRERSRGALAVGEPEHLLGHDLPAAAALPDLRRVHVGQQHFLGADPVHLLPDDLDDLGPHPDRERQQ